MMNTVFLKGEHPLDIAIFSMRCNILFAHIFYITFPYEGDVKTSNHPACPLSCPYSASQPTTRY